MGENKNDQEQKNVLVFGDNKMVFLWYTINGIFMRIIVIG